MKRGAGVFVCIVALLVTCVRGFGQQAAAGLVGPVPFSFTAAGQRSPILLLNGQGTCSVQVDNTGGGTTLTPQSTSDLGPNPSSAWNTASGVNSGSITTFGTFTGPVSSQTNGGLTGFSIIAASVTSGTVTGKISCSTATGSGSTSVSGSVAINGLTSPIPFPVTTPAPAPTCNTGTAVCVSGNQGTNNNVLQIDACGPLGTTCTDVHAAGTISTNPFGVQNNKYGTGAAYVDPIGDTFVQSGAISTAVTTLLVSGVAGQNIYVYTMAFQLSGTNASNTVNWEWGTGATCGTGTKTLYPQAQSPGTAAGNWIYGWSGAVIALTVVQFPAPAAVPLVIPAGNNLCGVTAGTTTAGVFVTYYANH